MESSKINKKAKQFHEQWLESENNEQRKMCGLTLLET